MEKKYFLLILWISTFTLLSAQSPTAESLQIQAKKLKGKQEYKKANEILLQANNILKAQNDWEQILKNLMSIAINFQLDGKHDQAVSKMELIIQQIKEKQSQPTALLGFAYHKFGVLYYFELDYFKSIEYYEKAIAIRKKVYDSKNPDLGRSYYNLGVSQSFYGTYEDAIINFQESINIRKKGNNEYVLAQSYQQTGNNYRLLGDYENALAYQELALEILIKLFGDKDEEVAFTYYDMGYLFISMKKNEEAKNAFQKALYIYNQREDPGKEANVLHALSGVYIDQEDYDQSLALSQKALSIHEEVFGTIHLSTAKDHNHLGLSYQRKKKYQQAIFHFNKALDIYKKYYKAQYQKHSNIAIVYDNLGNTYSEQENYVEAIKMYQLSLSHFVPSFQNIDGVENPGLEAIFNSNEKPNVLTVLSDKASAFRAQHNKNPKDLKSLERALATYELCSQLIDKMRQEYTAKGSKLFWISKAKPIFEKAISTCFQLYQIKKDQTYLSQAFFFSEKSKASLLVENRRDIVAQGFANIPSSILKKDKSYREKIVELHDRLYETEAAGELNASWKDSLLEVNQNYNSFIAKLEKEYPRYHKMKYDTEVISLSKVQSELLDYESCMIDFFYGEESVFIFRIDKNAINVLERKITKELEKNIYDFHLSISDPKYVSENTQSNFLLFKESAQYIYQYFLEDILTQKEAVNNIVFVRDGLLNFIPFECLIENTRIDVNDFLTLPYLIKKYTINYAYSATLLRGNIRRGHGLAKNKNLLAFAPDYAALDRNVNLAGAVAEVDAIAQFYPTHKVFQKRRATKATFKKAALEYGVIHLALHARANVEDRKHSALFFADTEIDREHMLFNYELSTLDLEAWLVVLSACETGVGELVNGEGVMSLAWGFMDAGTPSVVMSLWSTNDQSSKQLMVDFHQHLSESQSISNSMQQAKLAYLKDPIDPVGHPHYWAGFIATGASEISSVSSSFSFFSNNWTWFILVMIGGLCYLLMKRELHYVGVPKLES